MDSLKALQLNPQLHAILTSFWQWRKLWIFTTVGFCALAIVYSIALKRDTWVASQGLILRDEATGAVMRLGRFESQTQMKAAQETVLEMARNPQVVEAALKAVGRPAKLFGLIKNDNPPSKSEIEDFANSCVAVRAPRGAELGTTEVIYLDIRQNSKDRAVQLASALCDALESQLKSVRIERAAGVIQELDAAKQVCENSLTEVTDKLQKMEVEAGSDLADLRGLSDASVGSTYRSLLDVVREEIRKADLKIRTLTPHAQLAEAVQQHPDLLLQAANALADSHPVIQQLRDGLSEAMVNTATLEGKYQSSHPAVQNARSAEQAFRDNIRKELAAIAEGYDAAIAIAKQEIAALNQQEADLGKRLNRLADIRGQYTNLVAEVKFRSDKLSQINNELTETIAARDAAQAASLLTRLDTPVLGEKPIGPGRTTIVGGATVGGLLLGLGVAFLFVPLDGGLTAMRRSDEQALVDSVQRRHTPETTAKAKPATAAPSSSSQTSQAKKREAEVAPIIPTPIEPNPELPAHSIVSQSTTNLTGTPTPDKPIPTNVNHVEKTAETATSATAAARSLEARPVQRSESLDEIRSLISNALKCHSQGDNSTT